MPQTQADLNVADRHIARAELNIAKQKRLIAHMRVDGRSTSAVEAELRDRNETLILLREDRNRIIEALRSIVDPL